MLQNVAAKSSIFCRAWHKKLDILLHFAPEKRVLYPLPVQSRTFPKNRRVGFSTRVSTHVSLSSSKIHSESQLYFGDMISSSAVYPAERVKQGNPSIRPRFYPISRYFAPVLPAISALSILRYFAERIAGRICLGLPHTWGSPPLSAVTVKKTRIVAKFGEQSENGSDESIESAFWRWVGRIRIRATEIQIRTNKQVQTWRIRIRGSWIHTIELALCLSGVS